ncbi:hypothetical protein NIES37_62830 [Tolypothrix tenuis PCC 7101]|uniref:Uncharacterized protein n=1 Tax=Tolypothrix tenuis PCC 7101 TaxID=231146 RepID=A0A1Z4N971_9CYAN|nr:hypothetical protein NIES37_62830 [Tolypothrix tenuis PCC 7101]BAZ73808.1 hypothetical protein NIES50_23740 [Aulosira laxa NIES-50]
MINIVIFCKNLIHTNSNNVFDKSMYSRGQGSALPLQSVAFFFQIGITCRRLKMYQFFLQARTENSSHEKLLPLCIEKG